MTNSLCRKGNTKDAPRQPCPPLLGRHLYVQPSRNPVTRSPIANGSLPWLGRCRPRGIGHERSRGMERAGEPPDRGQRPASERVRAREREVGGYLDSFTAVCGQEMSVHLSA